MSPIVRILVTIVAVKVLLAALLIGARIGGQIFLPAGAGGDLPFAAPAETPSELHNPLLFAVPLAYAVAGWAAVLWSRTAHEQRNLRI
ncbi:hypothetical protein RxyAA322_13070 [Rubrobacter xylanophilus]|uniref:Uncharacterized protein n=1 Tax=Rubrobacter xylanophilus TaxID=49319 RepID=A0A510HLJ2_9ACTN|nr:hypothetical protein RxyAA322_13070 [Rubrobacter xylanophilus]